MRFSREETGRKMPLRKTVGWCFVNVSFIVFGVVLSKPYKLRECRITDAGEEYQGRINVTVGGLTCQRWDSQTPHSHTYTKPEEFPDDTLTDAANYCRNPGHNQPGKAPWCYTTDPNIRWQNCYVPKCPSVFPECKLTTSGTEYRGSLSMTVSGYRCKQWGIRSINHLFRFRFVTFNDDGNYCRNPDNKPEGPWCYIEGSNEDWEYCDVPFCKPSVSCKNSETGHDYVGTVGWTKSGRVCQRWDKQTPQQHIKNLDSMFPTQSVEDAANYCRNPDAFPGGPWCYTIDPEVRWETCDIPYCGECKTSDTGREYAGSQSVTASGLPCQMWNSQVPHAHSLNDSNRFPDVTLEAASNFCRNPDNREGGPWCFTQDNNVEWEYCNISYCDEDGPATPRTRAHHVLHIGIDGLKPSCMEDTPGGAPNLLHRMRTAGTSTLNKGRAVLDTYSGPNWSATLCGMPIENTGITTNSWCPPWKGCNPAITPVTGPDVPLPCVFQTAKNQDANIQTAAFYSWDWMKHLMSRGIPGSLDHDYYCAGPTYGHCDVYVVNNATDYLYQALESAERTYTFVYFSNVDQTGHAHGWCSPSYLESISLADGFVGKLLDVIEELGKSDDVLVMVSTDHGGIHYGHGNWADSDVIIPMFIRGPTVKQGAEFQHVVRNMDMTPTGLFALGLKPSPWMTGRVMREAFIDL